MTALPSGAAFQAEPMDALALSNALVALRDYLAELFGTDGTPATALATLGAMLSGYAAASGARSIAATDRGRVIAATGTWTLSLGAAATLGAGFGFVVLNTGSGTITLDPNASEQIDGAATVALAAGRGALVVCSGTEWRTLALPGTAGGQILAVAGLSSLPGYSFVGDPDTGMWSSGPDQLNFGVGGATRVLITTGTITLNLQTVLVNGSAAAPAVRWGGDADTGMFYIGADVFGFSAGGAERVRVTTAGLQVTGLLSGTAVAQSATDTTTGRVLVTGYSATALAASPANRLTAGGTANAITVTSGAGISGLPPTGMQLRFRPAATNTGATTLALDGGTARTCVTVTGAALPAGYVRTDADTVARFDGTNWVLDREPERGSNANGQFVRQADGTLVCTKKLTAQGPVSTASGNVFRSASISVGTYAATFAAIERRVVSPLSGAGAQSLWASFNSDSTSLTAFPNATIFSSITSAATDIALECEARGRWY